MEVRKQEVSASAKGVSENKKSGHQDREHEKDKGVRTKEAQEDMSERGETCSGTVHFHYNLARCSVASAEMQQ